MPTRLPREPRQLLPLAAIAAAAIVVLIASGGGKSASSVAQTPPESWQGLAGGQRPGVAVGQRVIVLLKEPSLADRVAEAGDLATEEQERQWTQTALASQRLLISRLAVEGVTVQPEYSYTRVVNGFSAAFDANGLAVLARQPDVAGVYPVRPTYPATLSTSLASDYAPGIGREADVGLSGIDGRGVTVALLDTGVDRSQPFLRGRVSRGIDVVGGDPGAQAAANPEAKAELEEHGTEMGGLIVGSGGPGGLVGVAPGANLLPIRVAGWQLDASGQWSQYGRTDQLIEGLEHAVDPNGDGDAHDAARIALVALSAPFAGFTDDPLAQAVEGATRLDTLVVVPAGNDGPVGPSFGSISGPGGAPDALTVGAADLRPLSGAARVVLRAGLDVSLDDVRPLAAGGSSSEPVDSGVGAPRQSSTTDTDGAVSLVDFFDRQGRDLVAGRAALVPVGANPATTYDNAVRAGATAVLFYGGAVPAGAIALQGVVPSVSIPNDVAHRVLGRIRAGVPVTLSLGDERAETNVGDDHVARFSSTGLAYDGRVKPELLAPGVDLGTSMVAGTDGLARYGTVNGTSAAAAIVAADAALLAQARPELDAEALKGLLVGSARALPDTSITAQGNGLVDVGGAAATEVEASPASLAIGRATGLHWQTHCDVVLRNVSVRRLQLSLGVDVVSQGAASLQFDVAPKTLSLGPGRSARVRITVHVTTPLDGDASAEGQLAVLPLAGQPIRVPWVITFGPPLRAALSAVHLSSHSFKPSDTAPALLSFVAGAVPRTDLGQNVQPVGLLDLELWSPTGGRIGLLARLRDVLPGRYSYGVTGRDPTGQVLPAGDYRLKLIAYPPTGGKPTVRTIAFRIQ